MGKHLFDKNPGGGIDRVDGVAKVTGAAKYSAEYDLPDLCYGILVGSTIAKGSVAALNKKAAKRAPGVLAFISHLNTQKFPGYEETAADIAKQPDSEKGYRVFTDNIIRF